MLRWQVLKLLPLLRPWLSLDAELGRYFRDERVRLAYAKGKGILFFTGHFGFW